MPGIGEEISPFRAHISDAALADLQERLARTRWPDQIPDSGWDLGTDRDFLSSLCEYWRDRFDWRQVEDQLNGWNQFVTNVDGQRIHGIHARSPHPDAVPLLLGHGWPGSVLEFLKILGPLTDPLAHGRTGPAFHVVAPSLPGYLFSGPTTERGWHIGRVAHAVDTVMHRLGYDSYIAQGGDWGSRLATELALHHPKRLLGIHLNLVLVPSPGDEDPAWSPTAADQPELDRRRQFVADGRGYSAIQSSKPQTLAYALNDSPVGLAAWIVEKFRTWSDCGGDPRTRFTDDELLAIIAGYWFTGTAGSAARLYAESWRYLAANTGWYVTVPTACALFPAEIARPPRSWAARRYNVTRWTELPEGGHFAAMEVPTLLADDIGEFAAELIGSTTRR